MVEEGNPEKLDELLSSRRNFLKLVVTLSGAAAVGSVASMFRVLEFIPPPSTGPLAWPIVKLANISSLDPSKPLRFNYPLVDTPSFLIKAGVPADNGVGPDHDIVAFSDVCQHLGCIFGVLPTGAAPPCKSSYSAPSPQGYCCCHGGIYDLLHSAAVKPGTPPPRPVPPVILRYDDPTGDLYAIGMGPPNILRTGKPVGVTDPSLVMLYDLQGGELVTESTLFSGTG